MASTYQGAATAAPGDWSARTVPETANSAQGGVLQNFYNLDRDPFYVLAVRSDGTRSW